MDYQYLAYSTDKKTVKGRVSAPTEERAIAQLEGMGFQIISLKPLSSLNKLIKSLDVSLTAQVKPKEVIMFSRQLAILLESGIDIISSIDLFRSQADNRIFKKILDAVISDLRGGSSFSVALSKHPKIFSTMYCRTIAAGEQSGNLDAVLKRMAEYIERSSNTTKKIKSALTYPIIVVVISIVVIAVLVFFVMPSFTKLYAGLGAEMPGISKILIGIAEGAAKYGVYFVMLLVIAIIGVVVYIRTAKGKNNWDKMMLKLPVIGPIIRLNELSRCCRTIAMLIRVGLPLPDILTMCIQSSGNTVVTQALNEIRQDMLNGDGLAQPMSKRAIFLPLMVQMAAVGEKSGNLGLTLTTVAESYETDADDKTSAATAMLQPALTIGMAIIVGFIVVAMISAMYGVYGQLGG